MIGIFLFIATQKTSVRELLPPSLKPIQSEDLPPRGFPSKKRNFCWDLIHPNASIREGANCGANQHIISTLNPKSTMTPPLSSSLNPPQDKS